MDSELSAGGIRVETQVPGCGHELSIQAYALKDTTDMFISLRLP